MACVVKIIVAGDIVVVVSMPHELTRVIIVVARIVPHATAPAVTTAVSEPCATVPIVVTVARMPMADIDVVASAGKVNSKVASLRRTTESRKQHHDGNDAR
jgi:hypothetical protein